MYGLMQDAPLTVEKILRRGEQYYPTRSVTTKTVTGIERSTIGEIATQARQVAGALESLGLSADARVGSFAWNTGRHLALYFGIPCTGRILHTINIRYFAEQVLYSINHAEDEAIFVDRSLVGVFAKFLASIDCVKHIIVMDDGADTELPEDPRVLSWAQVIDNAAELDLTDRVREENTAAALCYTTGTTGNPKGVLYSHRSIWLHANSGTSATGVGMTDRDNVLPVVPMFHAMAWGIPYTALLAGSRLTMPGPDLSPAGLLNLMDGEQVTYASGVPTIWMGMLPLLAGRKLPALNKVMAGGSAVPRHLSEAWRDAIGVPIMQGWGMTETSPVASLSVLRSEIADAGDDERADVRATAGMALIGVEMRIVEPETRAELPWDDQATGEIEVRGPWVARQYYRTDEPGEQFSPDGWLRTGDVGAISPLGYLRLVDRTKDLVKSGGEWISTVYLENEIMGHPCVAEAAVIAAHHPKWMERPLACVVVKPGESLTAAELIEFLRARVSGWQLPDDVVFIDEVPKTSVGKFSKKTLREKYADHLLQATTDEA
jgi:fatty-acyl-CoA synthase